jgi:hypothetical protein
VTDGAFLHWAGLAALGAFHGINPGMGWLFAVALGMQERRRRGVYRALLPLAAGHVFSVGGAVLGAVALGVIVPLRYLEWGAVAVLLTFGIAKLIRSRHPRWVGMRVGMKDLVLWSFLMASAHGAGLMVLPIVFSMSHIAKATGGHSGHAAHAAQMVGPGTAVMATLVHGAGYLLVTALVAVVVFEKFGVGMLRKAWFNLDLVWAVALIVTAGAILVI